ncbi:MAG: Pycsar system effector family protein, partial [Bacteroidota bacterium]
MSNDSTVTLNEANQETILEAAQEHVRALFLNELSPKFLFHNFAYATEIEASACDLMKNTELADETTLLIRIAALFYPVGYAIDPQQQQTASAQAFRDWAKANDLALDTPEGNAADWVVAAGAATAGDALPVRILHDAANSWLGRKRFSRQANLLQLEESANAGKHWNPIQFGERLQQRLINFNYLTKAGKKAYDERRRDNVSSQQTENYKIEEKEVKSRTGKNFGRGIDTMYRTAFRNHINLSRIADGKANMMISINTIILSIVITISGASLSFFEDVFFENPEFLVPIISLLLSSLIAVIFAVFSARPSVTEYRIKKDSLIKSKEASLLYFGNFLKLEKKEFVDYMASMKLNQSALYDDLAKDLYDLGQVMHKKYLLLTISYNTFVGGL